jgi:hypothetical protein
MLFAGRGEIMRTIIGWALALAWVGWAPQALANCDQLRGDIAKLDATSSQRPGYFQLRAQLDALYGRLCASPAPQRAQEFWYDLDGNNLGPAGGARPDKGAFTATAEIGRQCARTPNPSMCALMRGAFAMCATPPDDETKKGCTVLGAYPTSRDEVAADQAAPPLPPVKVTLGGQAFTLPPDCFDVLAGVADDNPADRSRSSTGLRYKIIDSSRLETMQQACPDVLAALERLAGARASDPGRFWPTLTGLAGAGFSGSGARQPPLPPEFCRQAEANMNTCKARWESMGPVDSKSHSRSGQAGAFADCYFLYQKAFGMCRMTEARLASRPAPPPPPPPAPAGPAKPSGGESRAPTPSPQPPQMSAQCQQLVSNYVGAAQANDGARALAGYNALKSAGGCGVLDKVDSGPPPTAAAAGDPRFPTRRATPLTDSYVQPCNANEAGCAQAMRQLEQANSPEAKSALVMHAISTGLQLGAAVANGLAAGMPQPGVAVGGGGGGTNMNSIGNRPVRSTYGQGAPTGPVQRNAPSDITGTK